MLNKEWQKSSKCDTGSCAEVRVDGDEIQLRDNKLGDASDILKFDPHRWSLFLADLTATNQPDK